MHTTASNAAAMALLIFKSPTGPILSQSLLISSNNLKSNGTHKSPLKIETGVDDLLSAVNPPGTVGFKRTTSRWGGPARPLNTESTARSSKEAATNQSVAGLFYQPIGDLLVSL